MARISQQTKDLFNLVATLGFGVACGYFIDETTKHEPFAISLTAGIAFFLLQVLLVFVASQDMIDLEEYRNSGRLDLKIKNAKAAQELKAIEEGRLDDARTWKTELDDSRKERKQ